MFSIGSVPGSEGSYGAVFWTSFGAVFWTSDGLKFWTSDGLKMPDEIGRGAQTFSG